MNGCSSFFHDRHNGRGEPLKNTSGVCSSWAVSGQDLLETVVHRKSGREGNEFWKYTRLARDHF
jgi:hypothetical protein